MTEKLDESDLKAIKDAEPLAHELLEFFRDRCCLEHQDCTREHTKMIALTLGMVTQAMQDICLAAGSDVETFDKAFVLGDAATAAALAFLALALPEGTAHPSKKDLH